MIYDWLQHIEFANVWVLPFLGMLPVFIFLYYRTRAARKSTITVSTAHAFKVKTFENLFGAPAILVAAAGTGLP